MPIRSIKLGIPHIIPRPTPRPPPPAQQTRPPLRTPAHPRPALPTHQRGCGNHVVLATVRSGDLPGGSFRGRAGHGFIVPDGGPRSGVGDARSLWAADAQALPTGGAGAPQPAAPSPPARPPGRPRLLAVGVNGRRVRLLPIHTHSPPPSTRRDAEGERGPDGAPSQAPGPAGRGPGIQRLTDVRAAPGRRQGAGQPNAGRPGCRARTRDAAGAGCRARGAGGLAWVDLAPGRSSGRGV